MYLGTGDKEIMKRYYFTFGRIHTLASGESLKDCYCVVYAKDEETAREKMMATRGNLWAFVYTSAKKAGVQRWHLSKVDLSMIRLGFDDNKN